MTTRAHKEKHDDDCKLPSGELAAGQLQDESRLRLKSVLVMVAAAMV